MNQEPINQAPLISVVIPTHNRAGYVKKATESVLSQTYKNIELIIIDDGSIDDTFKIISEYGKKNLRIVILRNEANLGFPKSLNKGIAAAQGKYIARLDDDDCWMDSKKLEKQIEFLENHPNCALVGGGAIWVNEKGEEIFRYLLPEKDEDIRKRILLDNCFVHSAAVFRKSDWEKAGGYNEKFGISCDWALWLELGKIGKFYNFQEYFVYYLKWDKNISGLNIRENLKKEIAIRRNYHNDYPGYLISFFLGRTYYISSFLPFSKRLRPALIKFKKIVFGSPVKSK